MFHFFKKRNSIPDKKTIAAITQAAKDYSEQGSFYYEDMIAEELRQLQYAFTHPSEQPAVPIPGKADSSEIRYSLKTPPSVSDDEYDPDEILKAFKAVNEGKLVYRGSYQLDDVLTKTFVERMLEYIDESGEKDSDIYNRVNIDRRLYSKMISDYSYTPSKDTYLMICIALRLSLEDTNDLIARCGYILSHSIKRDLVIECLIRKQVYDINTINIVLDSLQMKPLGRVPGEDI